MTRARLIFAATLVSAAVTAAASAQSQAPTSQAPASQPAPFTPILSGKNFTPPLRGTADIELTTPVTKRDKDNVVTKMQVKNVSKAPIARLTVDETWYDKGGATVAGSKGAINGLLQPGEIQTVTIETPYNPKMNSNNWNFAHANGTVNPHRVAKLTGADEKAPAGKTPAKPAARKK